MPAKREDASHEFTDLNDVQTSVTWFTGECAISIFNTTYGINEPTRGYNRNCDTSYLFRIDGYVKMRDSFYTRIIIRVKTILNQIDIRVSLSRYEDSCMAFYRPE